MAGAVVYLEVAGRHVGVSAARDGLLDAPLAAVVDAQHVRAGHEPRIVRVQPEVVERESHAVEHLAEGHGSLARVVLHTEHGPSRPLLHDAFATRHHARQHIARLAHRSARLQFVREIAAAAEEFAVVRDHDDADVPFSQPFHQPAYLNHMPEVKPARRLVQQQHLPPGEQGAGTASRCFWPPESWLG